MGKSKLLKYSRYILKIVKIYYAVILLFTPSTSWKKSWRLKRKEILTNEDFFIDNIKTFRNRYKKDKHDPASYKKRLYDYVICYLLFCLTADEYFQYEFMTKGWLWRNHHITIERRKYIDLAINDPEETNLLANKARFNDFYEDYVNRRWCDIKAVSEEEFVNLFSGCGRIIVKPRGRYGGVGIEAYDLKKISASKIYKKYVKWRRNSVVEEYLYQTGILHDVNPDSLNSIRVTTLRSKDQVDVVDGYFRCGCGDSIVDNFSSGGIIFPYNVETGEIYTGHSQDDLHVEEHPLSKIKVKGTILPEWELIKKEMKKAHRMLPEGIDVVGWDVCVIDGKVVLIEGNSQPGYTTLYDPNNKLWQKFKRRFNNKSY